MLCAHCQTEIALGGGRLFTEHKWTAQGAAAMTRGGAPVELPLHHDCQRERWGNIVSGLACLDEPLNDCAYFVRDGKSMHGWYEREGQRYPERLWACIDGYSLPRGFAAWLDARGWRDDWWKGRRPESYREDVLRRRAAAAGA